MHQTLSAQYWQLAWLRTLRFRTYTAFSRQCSKRSCDAFRDYEQDAFGPCYTYSPVRGYLRLSLHCQYTLQLDITSKTFVGNKHSGLEEYTESSQNHWAYWKPGISDLYEYHREWRAWYAMDSAFAKVQRPGRRGKIQKARMADGQ